MLSRLLPVLLLCLSVAWPGAVAVGHAADGLFDRTTLDVVTADGRRLAFSVELARDVRQRALGLMYRQSLAADAGMLFDFQRDQEIGMWMKNTFIPLDMLFLRADGTIHRIAERTVPHSLETVWSQGRVRAVLEVNAGTAARLGITPGDRIHHPLFGGATP